MADEARQDREMALKTLQAHKEMEEQERRADLARRADVAAHTEKLRAQIGKN